MLNFMQKFIEWVFTAILFVVAAIMALFAAPFALVFAIPILIIAFVVIMMIITMGAGILIALSELALKLAIPAIVIYIGLKLLGVQLPF